MNRNMIWILLGGFVLYELFKSQGVTNCPGSPGCPGGVPGLIAISNAAPATNIPPQPAGPCPSNSQWIWNGSAWVCALIAQTTGTTNTTTSWWNTVWGWLAPEGWDQLASY